MLNFILGLIGLVAVAAICFTIGAAVGLLLAIEAVAKDDKAAQTQLTEEIKKYWNEKKKES